MGEGQNGMNTLYNGAEVNIDLLKGGCIFKMDKYGSIEYNKGMFRKIKATAASENKLGGDM